MPTIAGRTRDQLIQAVGYHLPDFFVGSTTSAGGDTTSVIDTKLRGGNDAHNGKWVRWTSGTLDGEVSRADDYVQSSTDITVAPAFSATVPSGASYELWPVDYQPARIADFINQAILDTYGRAYNPVESLALHADGKSLRYDVPSGISALSRIYARTTFTSLEVHGCEAAWNESVGSGLTAAVDDEIKWRGNSSVRITVAASAAANALITDNITSLDISGKTHIEFRCRSSIATVAGDIHLLLDDTASAASPLETLSVPALVANTDTFVRIALATPHLDTALISVGVRFTTDNGASVFWIDDIQAVNHESAVWRPVSSRGWSLEKDTGDLVFTEEAKESIGYTLLKLVGGDAPLLLTADADVNEVDDLFVIYRATELAFQSRAVDKPEYAQQAFSFGQRAQARRKHLHRLRGTRQVS